MLIADPDGNDCDNECGALTNMNIERYVSCRLECILPDWTGLFTLHGADESNWILVILHILTVTDIDVMRK